MRYVTYRVTPDSGELGRVGAFFRDHGIVVNAIRDLDVLTDGSVVIRFDVAAGPERLRDAFEDGWPELHDAAVSQSDGRVLAHLTLEPTGAHQQVHEIRRSHAVLLEYPIEIVDQRRQTIEVTMVGRDADLQRLIDDTRAVATVDVQSLGRYGGGASTLFDELTHVQQAVLRTAVQEGYFSEPREATYEDLAAELDCTPSAVGTHLRTLQSKILPAILPAAQTDGDTGSVVH